jgi:hypothetical protein
VLTALTLNHVASLCRAETTQPDSSDVPDVVDPIFSLSPKSKSPGIRSLPAVSVCGTVIDATTGRTLAGVKVDCTGGKPLRCCSTFTDSHGFFEVDFWIYDMVFSAAGYDTLRVKSWTEIEKSKKQPPVKCCEPRDVVLTPSYRPMLEKR